MQQPKPESYSSSSVVYTCTLKRSQNSEKAGIIFYCSCGCHLFLFFPKSGHLMVVIKNREKTNENVIIKSVISKTLVLLRRTLKTLAIPFGRKLIPHIFLFVC